MSVGRARVLGAANDVPRSPHIPAYLGCPGPQLAVIEAQKVFPPPSALQAGGMGAQSSLGRTVNAYSNASEQKRTCLLPLFEFRSAAI
jgi:hypothetical protein